MAGGREAPTAFIEISNDYFLLATVRRAADLQREEVHGGDGRLRGRGAGAQVALRRSGSSADPKNTYFLSKSSETSVM